MIKFKATTVNRKSVGMVNGLEAEVVLDYLKDTTVKAYPGSVGIFAFDTRKQAEDFVGEFDGLPNPKILRVDIGDEKGKEVKWIPSMHFASITDFINLGYVPKMFDRKGHFDINFHPWNVPKGTRVYPEVKVID